MALAGAFAALLLAPALASAACTGGSLYVVAHADDTILFQSPDILHEIEAGACVQTVVVTAGDNGSGEAYWTSREFGAQAAYAAMAEVPNTWTASTLQVDGHTVFRRTLNGTDVSIDFLRLPDGGYPAGHGTEPYNSESTIELWNGQIASATPVDKSPAYTRDGLLATLRSLIDEAQPASIRTQDYVGVEGDIDHADHHAVAWFTREAQEGYARAHTLVSYDDYATAARPENVLGQDFERKSAVFFVYAPLDSMVCHTLEACEADPFNPYPRWLRRQYILDIRTYAGPPPVQDPAPEPAAPAVVWPLPQSLLPGVTATGTAPKPVAPARTRTARLKASRAQARLALWSVFGAGIKTPNVTCKLTTSTASTCTVSWRRKGSRYRGSLKLRDKVVKGSLRWQYSVDVTRKTGKRTTHIRRGYRTGGIV
jgi:LmbE family N-acetylglucosaminyl deacetylase